MNKNKNEFFKAANNSSTDNRNIKRLKDYVLCTM